MDKSPQWKVTLSYGRFAPYSDEAIAFIIKGRKGFDWLLFSISFWVWFTIMVSVAISG